MNQSEKLQTIKNVISDLEAVLQEAKDGQPVDEAWQDAVAAAEYITEGNPHP